MFVISKKNFDLSQLDKTNKILVFFNGAFLWKQFMQIWEKIFTTCQHTQNRKN